VYAPYVAGICQQLLPVYKQRLGLEEWAVKVVVEVLDNPIAIAETSVDGGSRSAVVKLSSTQPWATGLAPPGEFSIPVTLAHELLHVVAWDNGAQQVFDVLAEMQAFGDRGLTGVYQIMELYIDILAHHLIKSGVLPTEVTGEE
tara:strand:- start:1851 stop:2282 length:432 start_codon:yes stop_codon:yes gene_type:complete